MQKKPYLKAVNTAAFIVSLAFFSSIASNVLADSSKRSLEKRILHLEELSRTRNSVQAETTYQLSQLQREVRELTGKVEENTYKLKQIQDRQRELYRDIENRFSNFNAQKTVRPGVVAAPSKGTHTPKTSSSVSAGYEARRSFEAAFSLVKNKDYKAAIKAFKSFLKNHPKSSYSANALYWMGQVYLVKSNLIEAENQFVLLLIKYPNSKKADAAKLKLGDIFLKQKKWAEAKRHYEDVAKNSSGAQAQLARKGLDKLRQVGQ